MENTPQVQTPTQQVDNKDKILQEHIKDLEGLKLGYNIEYIASEIQNSYSVTTNMKEALKEAYNVLLDYFQDAKTKSKLLSNAFDKHNIRDIIDNAIELYANLTAINTLQELMHLYEISTEPDFTMPTFVDFTSKAKETVILLISKYVKNLSGEDKKTVINKIINKLKGPVFNINKFEKDFDIYTSRFEMKENITAGEYRVLQRVLKLIKYYYMTGIRFINETITAIKQEAKNSNMQKIAWKLVEAYAINTKPVALHDILCSNKYNMCYKWYSLVLLSPDRSVKAAIEVVEDYALVR